MSASPSYPTALLLACIERTRRRLCEHRPDSCHRQIEMKWVVLQRNESVLLVEAFRVVIHGEQVHREHADPLCHAAGRSQEVEQKQFAQTLTSTGQIDG